MQIQELAKKLEHLGLTDKEARVYVASLFLGPSPVQKIAEQAGVNRATTYVILDQLADFGLVSQSNEGKKTVFIAEEPQALDKLFDIQLRQIEDRKQELKNILPQLKRSQRMADKNTLTPVVKFYKGKDSVRNTISKMKKKLPKNTEILGITDVDQVKQYYPDIFGDLTAKIPTKQRALKNLSSRIYYSSRDFEYKSNPATKRATHRYKGAFKADLTLFDKAAVFVTYEEKDPIAVVIESQDIVAMLRQLYDLAWLRHY